VIYPQAIWYTFVNNDDIDEIIESHLINGKVVERLVI
jgi:(2Fe-2S) ferredoxin